MNRVAPNLFQTTPEQPFGNEVHTCAYLLRRETGNIVIYSSGQLKNCRRDLQTQGGVEFQLINHRHEASEHSEWLRQNFETRLICHEEERNAVSQHCPVSETFKDEVQLMSDIRAIPTPGHCAGSACFLWTNDGQNYLFTGDTLYLRNGLITAPFHLSDVRQLTDSLRRLAAIKVHFLVPGLFIGNASHLRVRQEFFRDSVVDLVDRIERDPATMRPS